MNNDIIEKAEEVFNIVQADIMAEKDIIATGYKKTKLGDLQRVRKELDYSIKVLGDERAIELANEIDSFLNGFITVASKREVKPLSMTEYYQRTSQYSQFAR